MKIFGFVVAVMFFVNFIMYLCILWSERTDITENEDQTILKNFIEISLSLLLIIYGCIMIGLKWLILFVFATLIIFLKWVCSKKELEKRI
jgi:uncharacterized membrane protein